MALRRKKIKDADGQFITKPRRCGICKENTTLFTVHGGIATGRVGGNTCCEPCYEQLKQDGMAQRANTHSPSEAETQISRRWGV